MDANETKKARVCDEVEVRIKAREHQGGQHRCVGQSLLLTNLVRLIPVPQQPSCLLQSVLNG